MPLGIGRYVSTQATLWLMGTQLPVPQKRGRAPAQFLAHVCGQSAGWIKMSLGMEAGLSGGHIVLDGDPAPPKGAQPPFSSHVYCGQTVANLSCCYALVSLSVGRSVGLGPKFLDNGSQPSLNRSPRNLRKSLTWSQA